MAKGFSLKPARRGATIGKGSAPRPARTGGKAPKAMGLLTKIGTPLQGSPIPSASMSPKAPKAPGFPRKRGF
jgi:hypothetical protein